jgi:N utilization substance protein A
MRLFEQEVPEIYDSTVQIRGCAREAGERTKIAVQSRDRDVDSVGACVGMKGMRVQSIIRELRGEKIDIIEYSEDPVVFATHALSPAKVSRITVLDALEHHMEVIVDDSQLSLAIGKKGQNVRLAAKLLGWKIDIKSEEEKRQEVESQMAALVSPGAPVSVLIDYGLAENIAEALVTAGIGAIDQLGNMTPEQLEEIQGIVPDSVERIQEAINAYYVQFEEPPAEIPEGQASLAETAEGDAGQALEAELEQEAAAENEGMEAPPDAESELGQTVSVELAEASAEDAGLTVTHSTNPASVETEGAEDLSSGPEGESALAGESATIENAGSPNHNASETAGDQENRGD